MFKLIQGDCIDVMRTLPAASIDTVICDPPYYRVMLHEWNGTKHDWDNEWESFDDYLAWLSQVCLEIRRVLKNNGSLFLFCDDKRSARIRLEIEKLGWCLINEIIWVKKNNMTIKGWNNYRCFAPITERVLFFANPESEYEASCDGLISNTFSGLRQYLIEEKDKVGITLDDVNVLVGTASMAGRHYFANSQWCFPTPEHYERMQLTFNIVFKKLATIEKAGKMSNDDLRKLLSSNYEVLRKDYEVLRKDYEELRKDYEELRRYFQPTRNYTDVWESNLTNATDEQIHPTQKPVHLLRRMIETTTREGQVVLDPFMGSGSTGIATRHLNRNFIGIERDSEFFKKAQEWITNSNKQTKLGDGNDPIPPADESAGILGCD